MFDWFWEFLYDILYIILYLIDFVVDVFRILAGLDSLSIPATYNADGTVATTTSNDLLSYLLSSTTITRAFYLVVSLSIVLIFLLTIIAVIRKQYMAERESRSIGAIVGQALRSSLMFLLVPVIMVAANALLIVFVQQLDLATSPYYYELYNSGATSASDATYSNLSIGGILLNIVGNGCETGYGDTSIFIKGSLAGKYTLENVELYYNIKHFSWILGYAAGIVILVLFIKSLFTFVERIFAIIGLYLVAPIAASSSVLDGGTRFKSWRDSVINKFIIAYSVLLAINLYYLIIPLIMDINFGLGTFGNYLIQLFFIIGGAFAVNKSTTWFGNIVNSGAGSQAQAESDSAGRALGHAAGAAVRTVGRAAGKVAGGTYNAIKDAAGFTTPMDRLKHRGEAKRKAKLEARDEGAAEKWKKNFYEKHPEKEPPNYAKQSAENTQKLVELMGGKTDKPNPKNEQDENKQKLNNLYKEIGDDEKDDSFDVNP